MQATSMGLGTCILGGTFNRSGFAGKSGLTEDELLPVISPVGYPRNNRSVVDKIFRFVAASDKRKPFNELFYMDNDSSVADRNFGRFTALLECVRLAPSASNKQPWRIMKCKDQTDILHFYLKRSPGYENIIKEIKLQNVDMGIAMCHFELSARELGLKGNWRISDPQIQKGGMEYIVSWIAHDQALISPGHPRSGSDRSAIQGL